MTRPSKRIRANAGPRKEDNCYDGFVFILAAHRDFLVMGELVNLKKFRKRIERDKTAGEAEQNRVRFGRTKAQKNMDELQARRAARELDQHLIDDDGTQP